MFLQSLRQGLFASVFILYASGASVAMAQHRGGGGGGGGHGGGGHGGGAPGGGGHVGGGHVSGGHVRGGGVHGGGVSHSGRPGYSGRDHSNFGSSYGYSRPGLSLSIGSGYPYGYGYGGYGLGYSSLGYGYGYPNDFRYSSGYRGYSSYPSRTYVVPSTTYVAPLRTVYQAGYGSSSVPPATANAPIDPATADLRPGMVLPDGSTVISVDPVAK
ncbi:hypothetical protein RISK_004552 [Rhodopirellula islandica]|uniref:Uncharacterized protein n=1 Tax=Rhodopirellula islandica TaxID=595434 RepID=A0A0J1B8U2_RHOIS|nr:hypothetical protein [Rhodopirellula islandica]KLU03240.1 hypothetical protein RISK_004552 [Rhodopirellula islandica]